MEYFGKARWLALVSYPDSVIHRDGSFGGILFILSSS